MKQKKLIGCNHKIPASEVSAYSISKVLECFVVDGEIDSDGDLFVEYSFEYPIWIRHHPEQRWIILYGYFESDLDYPDNIEIANSLNVQFPHAQFKALKEDRNIQAIYDYPYDDELSVKPLIRLARKFASAAKLAEARYSSEGVLRGTVSPGMPLH